MIIESIVTTIDAEGRVNCAPMGVEWGDDVIVLKPFLDTATYRNVVATGAAVVNLIDDARVFARAAISNPEYPAKPAAVVRGVVLANGCSWRELTVRSIDSSPPRSRIDMTVVHRGVTREFIGFNRARHAVLEAAIYATRLHLLSREFIESEMARLQVIVDKTAGPDEHEAMALLTDYIRRGGVIWNGTRGALDNFGTHGDTRQRATCTYDADGNLGCTGNERTFGKDFMSGATFGPGAGTAVPIGENWFTGLGSGFGDVAAQFLEDGSYVKLREISVGYTFDTPWVRNIGLSTVDVRLSGRNLVTWTKYSGIDPETSLGGAQVAAQGIDYFNNPGTRSFVITFGLSR